MRIGTPATHESPEAGRLLAGACTWAALGLVLASPAAAAFGGAPAVMALASGTFLAALSSAWLYRSTGAILAVAGSPGRARVRALLGFVVRQSAVAALLFAVLVGARWPATWLLVGVTNWPCALLASGFRNRAEPTASNDLVVES